MWLPVIAPPDSAAAFTAGDGTAERKCVSKGLVTLTRKRDQRIPSKSVQEPLNN